MSWVPAYAGTTGEDQLISWFSGETKLVRVYVLIFPTKRSAGLIFSNSGFKEILFFL